MKWNTRHKRNVAFTTCTHTYLQLIYTVTYYSHAHTHMHHACYTYQICTQHVRHSNVEHVSLSGIMRECFKMRSGNTDCMWQLKSWQKPSWKPTEKTANATQELNVAAKPLYFTAGVEMPSVCGLLRYWHTWRDWSQWHQHSTECRHRLAVVGTVDSQPVNYSWLHSASLVLKS